MNSVGQLLGGNKYQGKLNTDEWRGFARRIKRGRGNSCQSCRRSDVSLQVHHIFYEAGREPWEYADDEVTVLCAGCHKEIHEQLKSFRKFVFGKMSPQAFQVLNGALSVAFDRYDPLVFAHALAEFVSTPTMIERYAKAWGMSAQPKEERPFQSGDPIVQARTKLSAMQTSKKLDWKDYPL